MAAGDGFNEQQLADDIQTTSDVWEDKASAFLTTLENIATEQVTLDLNSADFISTGWFGFLTEMQTAISGTPVKPVGVTFTKPLGPGKAPEINLPATETVNVPVLNATPPSEDIPLAPEIEAPLAPVKPVLLDVSTPADPEVILPDAPTITAVEFPDTPTTQLPSFTQAFPVEPDLFLAKESFDYTEEVVITDMLDLVETKTTSDLNDGGYGIEPDDEQALYDRVRDRETQAAISEEENELRQSAARGFVLPPGVAQSRIDSIRQAARERISEANREIAVNRAELFRKTREGALDRGITIEAERLRYHGFRLERALNAQRFAAEFAVNVFDAKIRKYNIQLQAYESFVRGYSAQIQSELAKIEIFRTEVQAAVDQYRAKQLEVELYNSIVQAATIRVQIFESQIRAAGLKVDIERLKMETFRSEVESYATQIRANQAQVELFETLVRAEQTKVNIYESQVNAFRSQVQASGLENEIRNRDVTLAIAKAQTELAGYEQEVRKFVSDVAAEDSRVKALLSEYDTDTQVYTSALGAWEGLNRATTESTRLAISQLEFDATQDLRRVELDFKQQTAELENRLNATTAGVNLSREIITALYGTLNALSGKVTS